MRQKYCLPFFRIVTFFMLSIIISIPLGGSSVFGTGMAPSERNSTLLKDRSLPAVQSYQGLITTDTTWGPGTITITGDIKITSGAILEIEPDTVISFNPSDLANLGNDPDRIEFIIENAYLRVDESVTFTSSSPSPQGGDWVGINFVGSGGWLKNSMIEYASYGIRIEDSNPDIIGNHIHNIAGLDGPSGAYGDYGGTGENGTPGQAGEDGGNAYGIILNGASGASVKFNIISDITGGRGGNGGRGGSGGSGGRDEYGEGLPGGNGGSGGAGGNGGDGAGILIQDGDLYTTITTMNNTIVNISGGEGGWGGNGGHGGSGGGGAAGSDCSSWWGSCYAGDGEDGGNGGHGGNGGPGGDAGSGFGMSVQNYDAAVTIEKNTIDGVFSGTGGHGGDGGNGGAGGHGGDGGDGGDTSDHGGDGGDGGYAGWGASAGSGGKSGNAVGLHVITDEKDFSNYLIHDVSAAQGGAGGTGGDGGGPGWGGYGGWPDGRDGHDTYSGRSGDGGNGGLGGFSQGVYASGSGPISIVNTTVVEIKDGGMGGPPGYPGSGGGGTHGIEGPDGLAMGARFEGLNNTILLSNTILTLSEEATSGQDRGVSVVDSLPLLYNNDVWNFTTSYSGLAEPLEDIHADPEFVAAGSVPEFYRLSSNSPCVDAGENNYVLSNSDLEGLTRIRDGDGDKTDTVDMGAYEYQAFTLTIAVNGNGTVNKTPDLTGYSYQDQVDLAAVADPGWVFTNWSGDISGDQSDKTVTMDQDISAAANFEAIPYTLDVKVDGNGSVIVDPDQATYVYGDVVNLTANPDPGWAFSHWSGDASGDQASISLTIQDNTSVTAHFEAIPYTLDVTTDGSGSVTVEPDQETYVYGDVVDLTATADSGWAFSEWSGDASGTSSTISLTIEGNTSVTATFIQEIYTLDVAVDGNGAVIVDPDQETYVYGDVVNLTADPDPYWEFSHWSGDASGDQTSTSLTIQGDTSVTAHFVSTLRFFYLPLILVGN